jgi:hypothetical protein
MENRNLDKALDIVSKLIAGEEIAENGLNSGLYQEYSTNAEVYDIVELSLKKMNLSIYEYHNELYAGPGASNTVFGYTNEQLKRELGLRLNKELYLVYFIIYNIITEFYTDTINTTYAEFIRVEDIIRKVSDTTDSIIDRKNGYVFDEVEENSFKQIALTWDELPAATVEMTELRAAKNSKSGFVKLVCNFLCSQKLLCESDDRYYPTSRFRAVIENYFENTQGRMQELLSRKEEEYAAD